MNLGLSLLLYVDFLSEHFSQDWLISFFYILHEIEGPKYSKLPEPIFWGKILACPKVGQKAQNGLIYVLVHYDRTFFRIG